MNKLEKRTTRSQEKRIKKGTLTGCHIIVRQNGKSLLDKTYGFSSAEGKELGRDATYRIASMTKPITSAALLIEHESGRLNIYDDVSEYLPDFDNMLVKTEAGNVPAEHKIKVYMLVSHTSGIDTVLVESDDNPIPRIERNLENITEYTAGIPLVYDPGSSQFYNTTGFDIAARIIEKTSGMKYSEYLKTYIFDKLGMKDTTFAPSEDQWDRMVAIHDMKNRKAVDLPSDRITVIDGYSVGYCAAGCALISTAEDYSRFAEMLLNRGKASDGTQVMSEESVKMMSTPVVGDDVMPGNQKWGLGVRVITDNSYVLPCGSFGWSGKYGSHFWIDPVNNITAVYMKNSAYDGGAGCRTGNEFEKDVMKSI